MTQFTVSRRKLITALNQIKKVEKSAKKFQSTLEVTVLNNFILLKISGIEISVDATVAGKIKFTIPLWYYIDVVKSEKDPKLTFTVLEKELKLRGLTFNITTNSLADTDSNKSLLLPINYTYLDVLKLYLSGNYSIEEMIFNNIEGFMIASIRRLDIEVRKIEVSLNKYGVEKKDIETLMYDKLIKLPKEKISFFI